MMERQEVSSSAIRSVGYDPDTQTLELVFTSGDAYTYEPVDEATYDAVRSADSVGRAAMSQVVSQVAARGYTMRKVAQ